MKLEAGKLYRVLRDQFLFIPGTVDDIIFVLETRPNIGYYSTRITYLVKGCVGKTTIHDNAISYYLGPVKNCCYSIQ